MVQELLTGHPATTDQKIGIAALDSTSAAGIEKYCRQFVVRFLKRNVFKTLKCIAQRLKLLV